MKTFLVFLLFLAIVLFLVYNTRMLYMSFINWTRPRWRMPWRWFRICFLPVLVIAILLYFSQSSDSKEKIKEEVANTEEREDSSDTALAHPVKPYYETLIDTAFTLKLSQTEWSEKLHVNKFDIFQDSTSSVMVKDEFGEIIIIYGFQTEPDDEKKISKNVRGNRWQFMATDKTSMDNVIGEVGIKIERGWH